MGELEHFILLAILKLERDAYAITIREAIRDAGGKSVTRGALYRALDRLGDKALVRWEDVPGSAERGGHSRRRFSLTPSGLRHVQARRQVLLNLWSGSEALLKR